MKLLKNDENRKNTVAKYKTENEYGRRLCTCHAAYLRESIAAHGMSYII